MEIELQLIQRYKERLKRVWKEPNPYIQPLWEKSEIENKIKELERISKKLLTLHS